MIPNAIAHHYGIKDAPKPEVGMGATQYSLCDRYPYTVVRVLSEKTLVVQMDLPLADKTKPCPMGHQNWIIQPNPEAPEKILTLRKDGKWRVKGEKTVKGDTGWFYIGQRDYHYCWEY